MVSMLTGCVLTSDVTRVDDCLAVSFDQKHHCPRTVIGIKQCYPDTSSRCKVNLCWSIQRDGALFKDKLWLQPKEFRTRYQKFREMFIVQSA
jgi:hypothetical protein